MREDGKAWVESVGRSAYGKLYIPQPSTPNESLMSRFLAKLALECLALRLVDIEGGIEELASNHELDPIRNYARRGGAKLWPFHARALYPPNFLFADSSQQPYEVLHEWTLLYEDDDLLYLVIAIFGMEYVLNMGEPEAAAYQAWLKRNSGLSPLYPKALHPHWL